MKFRRDTNIVIYKAAEEAAETKYNKTIRLWQWINIGYFVVMVSIFSLIRADQ
jgi:predicted nucleic acid-binding protein